MSEAFDARCLAHPAFSSLEVTVRKRLAARDHFPKPSEFWELTQGIPSSMPPWFDFEPEDAARVRDAGGFDRFIARSSRIPTRLGSYHDLFGALIWLHFPQLKTAIHRIQLSGDARARSARENAATHLDESGVLVVSSDASVFHALGALDWHEVFWQRRTALLASTRFLGFGHGLLDALRVPHPRLMGMALFVLVSPQRVALEPSELRVFLDRELSFRVPEFLLEPALLQPLPVLGIPGWSHEQSAEFYQNEGYFRRARRRPRPESPAAFIALDG
jgi:hypothetical protein